MALGSIISLLLYTTPMTSPAEAACPRTTSHEFYDYRRGEGVEKTRFEENTLLTLNMDMLEEPLPSLYGGITAPIEKRAERLGQYISEKNPDIFLAQEVPLNAADHVYENLKNQFPHFWMGMGLVPGSKESGLFVASKYPIVSEPVFTPFSDSMQRVYHYPGNWNEKYPKRIIDRGFFRVETKDYWAVTSHLEPGDPKDAASYRRDQLKFITEEMDKVAAETGKPYILVGDFNIRNTAQEGDEYSRSGIPDLYYDFYTKNHYQFDESTYTCTNLLEAKANGYPEPTDPKERNEIDDYVLIRKGEEKKFKNLQIKLWSDTYDVNKAPDEALTDHRAYEAKFSF